MAPRIEEHDVKLAGFQAVVRLDSEGEPGNVVEVLGGLRERLSEKLADIPDRSPSCRLVGYWRFVAHVTRVYLLGVEVETLERCEWDPGAGFVSWNLGPCSFAVFEREGVGPTPMYYRQIPKGYGFDTRLLGDFEVCSYKERAPDGGLPSFPEVANEVWIPVTKDE